jgi:hypothetical protein
MSCQEIRNQLRSVLAQFKSKSFPRVIKARPEVYQAITHYCSAWSIDNMNEQIWLFMNEKKPPHCLYGNRIPFNTYELGYRSFCSLKCKCKGESQSTKLTSFWDGNVTMKEQIMATKEATNLERYGVKNHMQNADVRNKVQTQMQEKYGVRSNIQRDEVKQKIKATNQKKYGVDLPLQSETIREKANAAFVENHGEQNKMQLARKAFRNANNGKNPFQVYKDSISDHWRTLGVNSFKQLHFTPETLELINDPAKFKDFVTGKTMYEIARDTHIDESTLYRYISKYNLKDCLSSKPKSAMEFELQTLLDQHDINYIRGNRSIIAPLEIDFYFPDIKVGVELNGLFWHSDKLKKDMYHYDKYVMAKDKGVTLFQYWGDEWEQKKEIILKKILHLHGSSTTTVGARKLVVEWLNDFQLESDFLEEHHIQGMSSDRTKVICAKDNNIVVAVMAVKVKEGTAEVTRYATNSQASYPGLFSKMLKWFRTTTIFDGEIISFSDNCHANGSMYAKAGFTIAATTPPGYYVSNGTVRWRREQFRKQNIKKNYPDVYDESLTESQMIERLKYFRVWDAGKIKWVLKQ